MAKRRSIPSGRSRVQRHGSVPDLEPATVEAQNDRHGQPRADGRGRPIVAGEGLSVQLEQCRRDRDGGVRPSCRTDRDDVALGWLPRPCQTQIVEEASRLLFSSDATAPHDRGMERRRAERVQGPAVRRYQTVRERERLRGVGVPPTFVGDGDAEATHEALGVDSRMAFDQDGMTRRIEEQGWSVEAFVSRSWAVWRASSMR